jgi:hypothetical protein
LYLFAPHTGLIELGAVNVFAAANFAFNASTQLEHADAPLVACLLWHPQDILAPQFAHVLFDIIGWFLII